MANQEINVILGKISVGVKEWACIWVEEEGMYRIHS